MAIVGYKFFRIVRMQLSVDNFFNYAKVEKKETKMCICISTIVQKWLRTQ